MVEKHWSWKFFGRRTEETLGVTYELSRVGRNHQGDGPQSNHVTHIAT